MNSIRTLWRQLLSAFYLLRGDSHRHLGNNYGSLREYQMAIRDYGRAIQCQPGNAQAYYNRGVLHWRELRDHERAVQDLTRAVELAPGMDRAYFDRGMAYKLLGEWESAQRDFGIYLSLGSSDFWREAARRQLAELESIAVDQRLVVDEGSPTPPPAERSVE